MGKHNAFFLIAAAAAMLLTAACAFFVPDEPPVVEGRAADFPHDVHHSDDVGMDCVECHDGAEDQERAGMPTLGQCWQCHEEAKELEKPFERQLAGFVLPGAEEATWSTVTAPSIEFTFSHSDHVAADLDCLDCHIGADTSVKVTWDWKMTMSECVNCHDQGIAPAVQDCAGCHDGLDQNTVLPSHDGSWMQIHGALALGGHDCQDQASRNCSLCHQRSECDSCHASTEPISHTESWRRRGHGLAAQLDRNRCATCHTESSCDSCHRVEEPISHGVTWGGATSFHCVGCHIPLGSDDSCTACHRGTPSHRTASRRPGPPHPGAGSDCLSCHLPLEHIINGQDCSLCHR